MLIIDFHLDLAMNALAWNRDLTVPVHETQRLSDLQMREAHRLLVEVHGALAQRNQPKVREHVDNAIKGLKTALAIR